MINLSSEQKSVINAEIGIPIQVLATAGSGKTHVLTERIRHILGRTRKDGIIALTFTNKAAEELNSRLLDIEDVESRCWITTIHSIAQRILNQYGNTIGLPTDLHIFERDQDRQIIFLQSLINNSININDFFNTTVKKDRNKKIHHYLEKFSSFKKEMLIEEEIFEKCENDDDMWFIFKAYQDALLATGGIDFDDILVYAHKILLEQPWCGNIYRAKYKHVCIDEAQDLNNAQYEFIKALCGEQLKSIMMVGDSNQMIYGFNGSSHDYLCKKFVDDFSPVKFFLKKNFRSSKSVMILANKLKPNSQIETDYSIDGFSKILNFQTHVDEANWICTKISELITLNNHSEIEGIITLNKMVVIARNRFIFQELEKSLTEQGICYTLKKGEQQTEPTSYLGKIIDLAIRIKINPKDWIDGKKLCSALSISSSSNLDISSILQTFSNSISNSNVPFPDLQLQALNQICDIDSETPNISKFYKYFDNLIQKLGEERKHEIETSIELTAELERSQYELNDFYNRWNLFKQKNLGKSLLSFRNAIALGKISVENGTRGLTLSTVHTMKGLEKDIVFLTGMCEGVFPDYRALTPMKINEERNNAFVAVTRARRWIYITYPEHRLMPWGDVKAQKPSQFINDMLND